MRCTCVQHDSLSIQTRDHPLIFRFEAPASLRPSTVWTGGIEWRCGTQINDDMVLGIHKTLVGFVSTVQCSRNHLSICLIGARYDGSEPGQSGFLLGDTGEIRKCGHCCGLSEARSFLITYGLDVDYVARVNCFTYGGHRLSFTRPVLIIRWCWRWRYPHVFGSIRSPMKFQTSVG